MRNRYTTIIICMLLSVCMQLSAQTKTITILHTNDTHSRIEPLEMSDRNYPDKGGIARRKAYIDKVRKENKNVLLFDCGDFSQGTPYYNILKGEVEIECMNRLGYNAGTFGNHEFDFGMDNLKKLVKEADFPFVCTNYDFSGTELKNLVRPYAVLKINGIRIGVIGLGTAPEGMIQEKNYKGMKFIEPYGIAEKTASYLKNEKKCDIIICLSHLGMECEGNNRHCDRELAARTSSIDIILGGHSHTFMEKPEIIKNAAGREVTVSQMGKNGVFVGRIDITFEEKKK